MVVGRPVGVQEWEINGLQVILCCFLWSLFLPFLVPSLVSPLGLAEEKRGSDG